MYRDVPKRDGAKQLPIQDRPFFEEIRRLV